MRTTDELLAVIGERDQSPEEVDAAVRLRLQAYTLFVRAYDQVRRAVGFLRWGKDDAESIAPSLYAGRGKRSATEDETPEPTAPTVPGAPAAPGAPVATPGAPTNNVPVGFPGSNPFTS